MNMENIVCQPTQPAHRQQGQLILKEAIFFFVYLYIFLIF